MDCDYYTDAIDYTQVKVLQEFEAQGVRGREAGAGGQGPGAGDRSGQGPGTGDRSGQGPGTELLF